MFVCSPPLYSTPTVENIFVEQQDPEYGLIYLPVP